MSLYIASLFPLAQRTICWQQSQEENGVLVGFSYLSLPRAFEERENYFIYIVEDVKLVWQKRQ